MNKEELLQKNDVEIITYLSSNDIDKTLKNFTCDDLKELIDKMGGNRKGNISKRETFIKNIKKFVESSNVTPDHYILEFKNDGEKRKLLEILTRKIDSMNSEDDDSEEDDSEEDDSEEDDSEDDDSEEAKSEDDDSEEDKSDSDEEFEPVDSEVQNTTYLERFENNNIVHHAPWDNSKILLSGKGTLVLTTSIYSPLKDKGVNIPLGNKIYVTNEDTPLNNPVNKSNCIIASLFSYNMVDYYGCVMSGLILQKNDHQEDEKNICNEHLCVTKNELHPTLRIGKYGIDYNSTREGKTYHFFVGKEWIDKSTKKTYMYDVHPEDDIYQCYLPSKSLSKETEFTQYKKSKIKLVKTGRTLKKHTE